MTNETKGRIIPPQGGASSAFPSSDTTPIHRAITDRLAKAAEEAYGAMSDPSNDFNDTGDGRLMERLHAALVEYGLAAGRSERNEVGSLRARVAELEAVVRRLRSNHYDSPERRNELMDIVMEGSDRV